jgi:hypothetical protein
MDMSASNQRFVTRRLSVPAGLHVLRYVSAVDQKRTPAVLVVPKPDECEGLRLVFSPASPSHLARVGDCVVISADRPAAVLVTTARHAAARSDDVELRVERLDAIRDEARQPVAQGVVPVPRSVPVNDPFAGIFEIQGHVQRRGDCKAPADGWLGGAGANERIEAIGISWQRSAPGLRLHYGCDLEDGTQHVAKLPGQLVGSRGQALGITALRFDLAGKRAQDFELVVSASFQGGAVRTVAGRQILVAGPTGAERLTGLKLVLREAVRALPPAATRPEPRPLVQAQPARVGVVTAPARTAPPAPAPAAPVVRPAAERPKIRVFRASRSAV